MEKIIFDKITKSYEDIIIENINHEFTLDKSVAFVGRNGCGKSTLLKMIAGLMKPTSGKIIYSNKFNIRYVPDKFQPVNMITKEYIKTMCKIDGIKTSNTDTIINKWCERFEISDMINKNMKYLSKGTLQKIGIIQAIIVSPDILILDEPLSGLDMKSNKMFVNAVNELRKQGTCIFLSSHELDLVNKITDSIYTIRNKKLLKYNKSKSVQYTIIFDEYTDTDCFRNKKIKVNENELQKKLMEMLQNGAEIKEVHKNDSYDYI